MHYITGTSFSVKQHNGTRESQFEVGVLYQLSHILMMREGVKYTFISNKRHKIELIFDSCKIADDFIAKQRNEKLPNYQSHYENRND